MFQNALALREFRRIREKMKTLAMWEEHRATTWSKRKAFEIKLKNSHLFHAHFTDCGFTRENIRSYSFYVFNLSSKPSFLLCIRYLIWARILSDVQP